MSLSARAAEHVDLYDYAAAVLSGQSTESPRIIRTWWSDKVDARLYYIGPDHAEDSYPVDRIRVSIDWDINSINFDKEVVSFKRDQIDVPSAPDINIGTPSIDIYVNQLSSPLNPGDVVIRGEDAAIKEVASGLPNCTLMRWIHQPRVIKAVTLLNFSPNLAENSKCVAMALLYGLGLNVTSSDFKFSNPVPIGVMTPYMVTDVVHVTATDSLLIGLIYGGPVVPGMATGQAVEILKKNCDQGLIATCR